MEKFNLYLSGLNTSNGNALKFTVDWITSEKIERSSG